jgi:hypothetical protein
MKSLQHVLDAAVLMVEPSVLSPSVVGARGRPHAGGLPCHCFGFSTMVYGSTLLEIPRGCVAGCVDEATDIATAFRVRGAVYRRTARRCSRAANFRGEVDVDGRV